VLGDEKAAELGFDRVVATDECLDGLSGEHQPLRGPCSLEEAYNFSDSASTPPASSLSLFAKLSMEAGWRFAIDSRPAASG
jgi:hypothetical protein